MTRFKPYLKWLVVGLLVMGCASNVFLMMQQTAQQETMARKFSMLVKDQDALAEKYRELVKALREEIAAKDKLVAVLRERCGSI